ncbi:MAG: phosphoribosylglycinamide formyltransferase [Candidatus Melainabacteria bacterium GWF2_32_7]|nr:MAG: phosphoribosylglycinamide formyltransferase [Candidatus Melainabacteria bacterium GWF2_32_7]
MKKIAVFGSGNGSNFEAIAEYFQDRNDIKFVCISDKKDAFILERAKRLGIENYYVPFTNTLDFLKKNDFYLVVLAGYMRILPKEIVEYIKIINIHPSLLPDFKGMDAIKQAYEAGVEVTGVTVHYIDEGVDTGPVIAQVPVSIQVGMSLEQLEESVHKAEHQLYPQVIDHLLFNKIF